MLTFLWLLEELLIKWSWIWLAAWSKRSR